jgi:hypothetical protein
MGQSWVVMTVGMREKRGTEKKDEVYSVSFPSSFTK